MGIRDTRIDAYISKSAPFAVPILEYVREVVHEACPDVDETMKWGMPHFEYKGILCSVASFKAHCALAFWKGALVVPDASGGESAMGQFGRLAKVSDLPPKTKLRRYVKKAMELNETGAKTPTRGASSKKKPDIPVPADFSSALKRNRKALATFDGFSPGRRREYVEWITGAKTDATRARRMKTAIEWMSEGKPMNWKYK